MEVKVDGFSHDMIANNLAASNLIHPGELIKDEIE